MAGFEEFLAETRSPANPAPAVPPTSSPLDSFLTGESDVTRLKLAVGSAAEKDAQRSARVLRLQTRTGLAPDFIDRNLESVERESQQPDLQWFTENHPVVSSWMAEHPEQAAAVKDDYQPLGYIEKLTNALKRGMLGLSQQMSVWAGGSNVRAREKVAEVEGLLAQGRDPSSIPDFQDPYGYRYMAPEARAAFNEKINQGVISAVKNIAEKQGGIEAIPFDPVIDAALRAGSFAEFWHWFTQKPFEFISTIGAQSAPQMAPGVALAVPAGVLGGLPLAAGAIGIGSFSVDYPATVLEAMAAEGVDLKNPEAVWIATHDTALMGRVGERAFAHAVPVAALDAVSGGVAGKTLVPATRLAGRPIVKQGVNLAVQATVQGTLGAAGEAAGEVVSGQPLHAGQIGAEFWGEFATAPVLRKGRGGFLCGARGRGRHVQDLRAAP